MRTIFWKLFFSYFGIAVLAFVVLIGTFALRLAARPSLPGEGQLESLAERIAAFTEPALESGNEQILERGLEMLGTKPGPEIIIAGLDGRVLFSTLPRGMWKKSGLEKGLVDEIIRKGHERGFGIREAFPRRTWFVAVPVIVKGAPAGVVHVSFPQRVSAQLTRSVLGQMSRSLLVALSVAVLLIFALSYHLTRPLEALRYMCNRIAEGDYSVRISEKRKDEIGELARTMNAMAARIEKNLRQSTDFFTNVSHELKTPLASIQGHAEALLDKVTISPEESRSYLEIINREAVRMSRLSGNLLDIARFEDGRVVLAREMVNLSALAGEVADGLRIEAQKKGVTIHARVSDSLPEVSADGARLHQVLSNLVENAIKYGQENGDIWIESGISSRQVRISVRDRGPGIPPEEIPRIFDRFYRIEKSRSRKAGGSGLGLALSRLIVEAHGGTLTVESALNEGTTFTMSLPAKS